MEFKNRPSYFRYSKGQRAGVFFLLIVIVFLQLFYFLLDEITINKDTLEQQKWNSLQSDFDVLKSKKPTSPKLYSFNPNFISDYKGYKFGMSVQEIDRLFAYRKKK